MSETIPGTQWLRNNSASLLGSNHLCNRSLFLDKYVFWLFAGDRPVFPSLKRANLVRGLGIGVPLSEDEFQFLSARRLSENASAQRTFSATTKTRMIVGMGGESVLETGITLHRYWGFPVIPGSALKGVLHHYVRDEHPDEDALLTEICGREKTPERAATEGKIVFLDAWPASLEAAKTALTMDIMTPHYSNYYLHGERPSDDDNPVPIPFLAVDQGVVFTLIVTRSTICGDEEAENLLDKAGFWLKDALVKFGVGAKTGSSYGYFQED